MRRTVTLILALAAGLLIAAPALADTNQRIYNDCMDNGRIDGRYTQRQFKKALNDLPADLDEYSDCRDVIRRAQLAAAAGGRGSGGGGGAGGGGGIGGGSGGGGVGTAGGSGTGAGSATGTESGAGATRDPLGGATPDERRAFDAAVASGGRPVTLAGDAIRPGVAGRLAGEGHDLPAPLIALLALVAAALAAGAATLTWTRLRGVRARGAG